MLIRLCSVGWVIGRSVGQSFVGGVPGFCAHLRGGLLRGEARATLKGGLPSQLFLKTYDEGGSNEYSELTIHYLLLLLLVYY